MKIKWILILCFVPLTLFVQNNLECCESVQDVEASLNGYWKLKPSDLNEQLRFQFNDGVGVFWSYKFDDKDKLIEVEK